MQKKDDKVGNKTDNKDERQRKKGERKRKIEINSQKKRSISQKKCLFQQNLFLAILILISRKPVQRIGIGEECVFFGSRRPSPKG